MQLSLVACYETGPEPTQAIRLRSLVPCRAPCTDLAIWRHAGEDADGGEQLPQKRCVALLTAHDHTCQEATLEQLHATCARPLPLPSTLP